MALSPSATRYAYSEYPGVFVGDMGGRLPLQIDDREDDGQPAFLDDERLAYSRDDDAAPAYVVVATIDGKELARGPIGRWVLAARGDHLLLRDPRGTRLSTWTVGDADDKPVELPSAGFDIGQGGLLADGTIVLQSHAYGDAVWELPQGGAWRTIYRLPVGETSSGMAVAPDGRIIVSVSDWSGDLFEVRARRGARF
jgi:hypothetical protein